MGDESFGGGGARENSSMIGSLMSRDVGGVEGQVLHACPPVTSVPLMQRRFLFS